MSQQCDEGFCGIGHWEGVAEVYDGQGTFLANGADQRHVRSQQEDGRIRIDLSFVGPLKFSGHYYIDNKSDRRLYQGPVNCGYAQSLSENLVIAKGYWPVTGLSQSFFLMLSPDGNRQLSLALMSRGEQLIYSIVGENGRVVGDKPVADVTMQNGIAYDLKNDVHAGRGQSFLHRPGRWVGVMNRKYELNSQSDVVSNEFEQFIGFSSNQVTERWSGCDFLEGDCQQTFATDGKLAWSQEGDLVGSYSMYGGRALSGHLHYLPGESRVWRREVVSGDGCMKAVVNLWYRGETHFASEWGLLSYEG